MISMAGLRTNQRCFVLADPDNQSQVSAQDPGFAPKTLSQDLSLISDL